MNKFKKELTKIKALNIFSGVQQMYPWNDEDPLNLVLQFGMLLMLY
jgi:hypothetical protein